MWEQERKLNFENAEGSLLANPSSVGQNAAISVVAMLIQGIANLITVIYLARVLHPTNYGTYNYTWTIVGLVSIVTYFGLPPLLTRQLSRATNHSSIVTDGISMTALLSMTATIGFIGCTFVIPGLYRYRTLFDLWAIIVLFNGVNPRWVFSGIQKLWIPSIADMGGAVTRFVLIVSLVHSTQDLGRAVGITVISIGAPMLGQLIWLRWLVPFRLIWMSWRKLYEAIRMGIPLGINAFVGILYSGLDTWILHIFIGSHAVGIYSAGYRLVIFMSTFSALYFYVTYPILSRLAVRDQALTQQVVQLASLSIAAIVVPIGIGVDLVSHPLIRQAFGRQYGASAAVLSVVIWSWGVGLLRDTFSTTLVAGNRETLFARLFVVSGCINGGLMWYMVRWGPVGTAFALVVTQVLLLVLCIRAIRHVIPHPLAWRTLYPYVMKIMVNSMIMGVCVWLVRAYLPVEATIAVGVLIYAGLTWGTHAVPWEEVLATLRQGS